MAGYSEIALTWTQEPNSFLYSAVTGCATGQLTKSPWACFSISYMESQNMSLKAVRMKTAVSKGPGTLQVFNKCKFLVPFWSGISNFLLLAQHPGCSCKRAGLCPFPWPALKEAQTRNRTKVSWLLLELEPTDHTTTFSCPLLSFEMESSQLE
jgi:hypothetical protein